MPNSIKISNRKNQAISVENSKEIVIGGSGVVPTKISELHDDTLEHPINLARHAICAEKIKVAEDKEVLPEIIENKATIISKETEDHNHYPTVLAVEGYVGKKTEEIIETNSEAIEGLGEQISGIEEQVSANTQSIGSAQKEIDDIKKDYLTSKDKESLQTQINTIVDNPDTEGVINSIKEFTKYIEEDGEIAEGFRKDIDQTKKDIQGIKNGKDINDFSGVESKISQMSGDIKSIGEKVGDNTSAIGALDTLTKKMSESVVEYLGVVDDIHDKIDEVLDGTDKICSLQTEELGRCIVMIECQYLDSGGVNSDYSISIFSLSQGKLFTDSCSVYTDGSQIYKDWIYRDFDGCPQYFMIDKEILGDFEVYEYPSGGYDIASTISFASNRAVQADSAAVEAVDIANDAWWHAEDAMMLIGSGELPNMYLDIISYLYSKEPINIATNDDISKRYYKCLESYFLVNEKVTTGTYKLGIVLFKETTADDYSMYDHFYIYSLPDRCVYYNRLCGRDNKWLSKWEVVGRMSDENFTPELKDIVESIPATYAKKSDTYDREDIDTKNREIYDYIRDNSITFNDGSGVDLKTHTTVATEGQTTFSNPFLSSDNILIFHNGVLLIEGNNYTITDDTISLKDYIASKGDTLNFIRAVNSEENVTKEDLNSVIEAVESALDESIALAESYISWEVPV